MGDTLGTFDNATRSRRASAGLIWIKADQRDAAKRLRPGFLTEGNAEICSQKKREVVARRRSGVLAPTTASANDEHDQFFSLLHGQGHGHGGGHGH